MRSWKPALAALTIAALASACAGAAASYEGDNSGTVTSASAAPAASVSPLEQYTGLVWGSDLSPEAQQQLFEANILRREELIAECMHLAGFDYVPFTESFMLVTSEPLERHPDNPEWVAEFGFGVLYASTQAGTPGMPGIFGRESGAVNPNREIELSLTEPEREAYRRTLNGIPFPWEYDAAGNIIADDDAAYAWHNNPENWGCRSKAWHQALAETPFGLAQSDQFAPLFEAVEQFQADFALEVTEPQHDWAMCMATAGHSGFTVRPNFVRYFSDQLDELTRAGIWFPSWPLTPGDQSDIRQFAQREIDTALADLRCRQSTDFDARQAAARTAAEIRFVNDHRNDLEALRATAEQLG